MLQSKWILSLFFLTMLQFEAATTEKTRYLVQAHSEATLHCENVKLGLKQCKGTTWIFSGKTSRAAVELILLGEIKEKSGRQSLSENCSLVINNVTAEDAGFYTCQQWRGTKESTGDVKLAEDSFVYLSVVTVTGQWKNDLVTLRCSVSTVEDCPYTVEWQHGGRDIDVRTSTSSCSASQTFSRPCDDWSRFQSLRCRVKNKTGIEKKFFNPPSICETPGGADSVTSPKTTAKTPTTARATTAPTLKTSIDNKKSPSTTARLTATPAAGPNLIQHWLFYIAGAAAVFVAVAAAVVIGWKIKRKRRSKEKADIVAKDPEDLLSYATIGFTRSGTDANLHHKDLVTYSTVRDASSCTSSSAVHVDPNALYAQINKP